jgi:protein-disulfide isomerase
MKKLVSMCILLIACHDDPRIAALEKRVEALEKQRPAARPAQPDPNLVQNIPLHDDDVTRGTGKTVIVEAFDFACPYCAMSAPALKQLADKHPDQVKIVSKQFVVHPETATLPALGACAAQKQSKGPAFEHEVWTRAWTNNRFDVSQVSASALDDIAKDLKLDVPRFRKDRDGSECKAQLDRDAREMASIGVRGTPAFYVNGKVFTGPRTLEGFEAALKL